MICRSNHHLSLPSLASDLLFKIHCCCHGSLAGEQVFGKTLCLALDGGSTAVCLIKKNGLGNRSWKLKLRFLDKCAVLEHGIHVANRKPTGLPHVHNILVARYIVAAHLLSFFTENIYHLLVSHACL